MNDKSKKGSVTALKGIVPKPKQPVSILDMKEVMRGEAALRDGKTLSQDDVEKAMSKWLTEPDAAK